MRYINCLVFTFLFSFSTAGAKEVKDVFYGTATEKIELPFGEKTVLIFNKRVKSHTTASSYLIRPEDDANPDYTTFVVSPKFTKGTSRVTFSLEDEKSVRLEFITTENKDSGFKEFTYEIRPKAYVDVSKAPPIGEVELLKEMIKDSKVLGYKRRVLDKPTPSGRVGVKSRLIRSYNGRNLHGYVFEMTNMMKRTKVEIDVKKLKLGEPNLAILTQADSFTLYPKSKGQSKTRIRIVAKPSSSYKAVLMPTTLKKVKGGK